MMLLSSPIRCHYVEVGWALPIKTQWQSYRISYFDGRSPSYDTCLQRPHLIWIKRKTKRRKVDSKSHFLAIVGCWQLVQLIFINQKW